MDVENVYDTAYHATSKTHRESERQDPRSIASNYIGRVRPNRAMVIYREKNEDGVSGLEDRWESGNTGTKDIDSGTKLPPIQTPALPLIT